MSFVRKIAEFSRKMEFPELNGIFWYSGIPRNGKFSERSAAWKIGSKIGAEENAERKMKVIPFAHLCLERGKWYIKPQ